MRFITQLATFENSESKSHKMAICPLYLDDGWCSNGMNCKNTHMDCWDLMEEIKTDMRLALRGKQWPFSCYSPLFGHENMPTFTTDQSFEESRFLCYEAKKTHTFPAYTQKYKQDKINAEDKIKAMMSVRKPKIINLYRSRFPKPDVNETQPRERASAKNDAFAVIPPITNKNKPKFEFTPTKSDSTFKFALPVEKSAFEFSAANKNFNFPPPAKNPFSVCTCASPDTKNKQPQQNRAGIEPFQKVNQPTGKCLGPLFGCTSDNQNEEKTNEIKDESKENSLDSISKETISLNADELVDKVCASLKSELQIDKLIASVQSLPEKLDSLKMNDSVSSDKKDSPTSTDNKELRARMKSLEIQNHKLQYQLRRDNIRINGVKVLLKEDLFQIAKNIGKHIGCEVSEPDISNIYREVTAKSKESLLPPAIIVKFTRTLVRDNFMRAYRDQIKESANKGSLVASDICNEFGDDERIYVGEHLTPNTAHLLRYVKKMCKGKGIEFVWVRNDVVFVRKNKNSKAIKINDISDIMTI